MRAHVFLIEGDPSNTKEATQTKKRILPNCKDNANSRNAESPPTKIAKNKHPIPISNSSILVSLSSDNPAREFRS